MFTIRNYRAFFVLPIYIFFIVFATVVLHWENKEVSPPMHVRMRPVWRLFQPSGRADLRLMGFPVLYSYWMFMAEVGLLRPLRFRALSAPLLPVSALTALRARDVRTRYFANWTRTRHSLQLTNWTRELNHIVKANSRTRVRELSLYFWIELQIQSLYFRAAGMKSLLALQNGSVPK